MDARRRLPSVALPRGVQYALTWGIPDNFGGMTSALLHRSRAFVRLGGRPVDILTFDARPDYDAVERTLRERGELIDGMRLLNLWDWLRSTPLPSDAPGALNLERDVFTPIESREAFQAVRFADDGTTVLQVDYYRADGSLLATDRRDVRVWGELGGRSVVLCDESGTPVRSFSSIWALYRFWLDLLRERRPSFLIVDSKTVANFVATYRRKRAVTMHIVHNSHRSQSRQAVFDQLEAFDSVDILTPRQLRDVEEEYGRRDNLAVIPNSRDLVAGIPAARPVEVGMVLASLTTRKRVDHAIAAVSALPVTLDIYGDGPERVRLEHETGGNAVFHGHDVAARERLAGASFILLTASSEGFPLVLVEAMAAGCLPIAYDVPYGPADVIVDGVNGFLVPPGDIAAMTAAIERLLALSPRAVARMRRAARRTAEVYSDVAVTRLWAAEMKAAAARKAAAWPSAAKASEPKASQAS